MATTNLLHSRQRSRKGERSDLHFLGPTRPAPARTRAFLRKRKKPEHKGYGFSVRAVLPKGNVRLRILKLVSTVTQRTPVVWPARSGVPGPPQQLGESCESGEWVLTQIDRAKPFPALEQIANALFVVHDDVQVDACNCHIGVSRGGANLG